MPKGSYSDGIDDHAGPVGERPQRRVGDVSGEVDDVADTLHVDLRLEVGQVAAASGDHAADVRAPCRGPGASTGPAPGSPSRTARCPTTTRAARARLQDRSGGCQYVRVDAVGDALHVVGVEFETGDELFDHEPSRRDEAIGLERQPPLDRVDVGRIAERQLTAVAHAFGAVHGEHERNGVHRRRACRRPSRFASRVRARCRGTRSRRCSVGSSRTPNCAPSFVNAWLADAVRATVSTGGSHGRSTAVRSTRTDPPASVVATGETVRRRSSVRRW